MRGERSRITDAQGLGRLAGALAVVLAALLLLLLLLLLGAGPAAGAAAPEVSSVAPARGPAAGGSTVTIRGSGFEGATEVRFGSRTATFKVLSPEAISAIVPPWSSGNAIAEVTVTAGGGTSPLRVGDSFLYEPAVTSVEPASGTTGTAVVITGSAFQGRYENGAGETPPFLEAVRFGSTPASGVTVESSTRISATAPPGLGVVDVGVETLAGRSAPTAGDVFTYGQQPLFYSNGSQLASAHLPVMAWGALTVTGALGAVSCTDVLDGSLWNEGGYGKGIVESLSASKCADPELCEHVGGCLEGARIPGEREASVYVTAEMPVRAEELEGQVCSSTPKPPCASESERERVTLITALRRAAAISPWRLQLAWGEEGKKEAPIATLGPPGLNCYPTEASGAEGEETLRALPWNDVPEGCVRLNVVVPQIPIELAYYGRLEAVLVNGVKSGLTPSRMKLLQGGRLVAGGGRGGGGSEEGQEASVAGELKLAGMGGLELVVAR